MNISVLLKKPWGMPLLVFLFASLFYTWNLSGQYYQLDEAGTILQSEGIANLGYPAGWDGRTLISDNNGREYHLDEGSYFYTWQPPLQSYTAYLGGQVFGKSVFGYRFFFALFGAATVALLYHIANLLFKKRHIVWLVTAQLMLLLPFFLYVRQVRYYAPSAFFSTVFLYLFIKAWKQDWGMRETILLFMTSTALFLTNYFVWAGSVAFLGLFFLWQRRRVGIITLALSGILPLLWYIILRPFSGDPTGAYAQREMNPIVQFLRYLPYIHSYLLPLFFLPLFFLGKLPRIVYFLAALIGIKLVLYSILLNTHGRYLIDLMPVFVLLFGFLYTTLDTVKTRVLIPVIFLTVVFIVNPGSIMPKAWVEQDVRIVTTPLAYRTELFGEYPSVMVPLASYMSGQYQEGDIFWINNDRDILTVQSGIPHFSPVCDVATGELKGPDSVSNKDHIRWFIFLQDDPRLVQDLKDEPCFGEQWQERLEKEYVKSTFQIPRDFYPVNDPDVVGRNFFPQPAEKNSVIIYEKRKFYAYKKT